MAKKIPKNINTTYDIVEAFRTIEDELIASMIRNLDHHRAEELKEGKNWSMWQVEQLAALDEYKKRNLKKYQGIFANINSKISAIISLQRAAGNAGQEISILKAIKDGAKLSRAKKQISAHGKFFKLNDEKINALIKATEDDFKRGEIAILRRTEDQYRKIIFNAQMYASSGASYEAAMDMATKDFLSAGINCIEYKNGARHTMSEYADMALRTAQKRAYLTGEGEKRQEWGISTVIMNKRGNPCPKCLPFVGKVLIDDVWSGGKAEDGPYPLMSKAIAAGLYHPRCKDSHTTYFPDISTADDIWTKEELEEIGQQNRQEAMRQYAQRQAERMGRLAAYSLAKENQRKYAARETEWKKRAEQLSITEESDIIALSDEEQYALNQYMSFESYSINDKLRNGIKLNESEQKMVDNLDRALKKMPYYKGDVTRSLYFGDKQSTEAFMKNMSIGKKIQTKEFISTTNSTEFYNPDGEVQMIILDSKRGRNIVKYNAKEKEILYERNSMFRVADIEYIGGKYYIKLEEL